MNNTEIERKWLLNQLPSLPHTACLHMEQGYLSFAPSVRIRKTENQGQTSYRLCIKGPGTLQRTEVEVDLQASQYNSLTALLAAPLVRKTLYTYALPGGHTLECSLVDEGEPTSFCYAEVEFASVEEAGRFTPPPFLGREVTEEPGQSMAAYARYKALLQQQNEG